MDLACLLTELLPGVSEYDPGRPELLKCEIARLLPLVHTYLDWADIPTLVRRTEPDTYHDKETGRLVMGEREVERWDLIEDYFEHAFGEGPSAATFNMLMQTLESGIGVYEAARDAAFRDLLNPLSWIAWLVGLPLTVLERAGLAGEASTSVVGRTYAWIIRVVMVALLILVMAWLGVTIPWDKLLAFALR